MRTREVAPGTNYEIDTPNAALAVTTPGDIRVDVAPDGHATTVTVRSGGVTAYGDCSLAPLAAGQQITFEDTNLQQASANAAPDAFDQWQAAMRRRIARFRHAMCLCRATSPAIRSRCQRHVVQRSVLWRDLGAELRAGGLGAVSARPLGLVGALGPDLGRRCAVGLRAVSLRPLGLCARNGHGCRVG